MAQRSATPVPLVACAGVLVAGALLLLPGAARADGGTAGSLISREDAIRNATLWMPSGARITSTNCTEMVIDSSLRYFCSVQWGPGGQ